MYVFFLEENSEAISKLLLFKLNLFLLPQE